MRRCAQERMTEDEIKNGAMPMSSSRAMAPGASLQCIVESTWWPVSAASIAISAVSVSRISPIMTMSGSWRRMERRALAKVRPMSFLVGTWLMPGTWNSTGSSTVTMFHCHLEFHRVFHGDDVPLRAVQLIEGGIKRRGLAGAGRTGDENQSVRRVNGALELLERVGIQA